MVFAFTKSYAAFFDRVGCRLLLESRGAGIPVGIKPRQLR